MTRFILLAFLFTLLSLGGCDLMQTRPDVKIVTVEKLALVEPDAQYLNDCKVEPWPFSKTFHTLGMDEKEDALTRVLIAQYANTTLCSNDKRSIREEVERQRKIVDAYNAGQDARAAASKAALEKGN